MLSPPVAPEGESKCLHLGLPSRFEVFFILIVRYLLSTVIALHQNPRVWVNAHFLDEAPECGESHLSKFVIGGDVLNAADLSQRGRGLDLTRRTGVDTVNLQSVRCMCSR
jgi:hypothetical protein